MACGIGRLQNVPAAADLCLSRTSNPAISGRGAVSFAQAGWLSLARRIAILSLPDISLNAATISVVIGTGSFQAVTKIIQQSSTAC
jgi:hypothetical protein